MAVPESDKQILRKLASQTAEIAALPVQEEKRSLWRKLNSLKPERPMVMIDQVCWNEMNVDDELTLCCENEECRGYETTLKRKLYQWKHFPVDMVVEPYIKIPKAVSDTGFGMKVHETTVKTEEDNPVLSHKYENQFQTEDDLEKIKTPVITHDEVETERRMSVAHEIFDGVLPVVSVGKGPYLSLWDPLANYMGVENALETIIDNPELIHRIVGKMTDGYMTMLDQMEEKGLLCGPQELIHCTGAYTDELPALGYDENKPRTKDIWAFGLAQMLCTVSPAMFEEFEIDYFRKICERFGLVYYGCCDPLDGKMEQVRKLPNVRKVSMSPWANPERGAEEIGGDYVFSNKPNPALVAGVDLDENLIRRELTKIRELCEKNNCPLEFILKDLSTVRHQPERLWKWGKIAMEVAAG